MDLNDDLPDWLMRHAVDAGSFADEALGWVPDEKQLMVLRTTSKRVVLNCSRAWGKSTVTATRIVHLTVMRPGRVAIIISENMAQTAEFFQKIDGFLERLGIRAKAEQGKALARRLPNGSRIVGLAAREEAVRGYQADFVFIDEAARIEDEVIDAFTPVLAARRGDLWMASTPRGKRGRFWEIWTYGDSDWLKVSVPASENARLDRKLVEKCRREQGDGFVRQEFGCEFIENGVELLSMENVDEVML